MKKLLLLSLVCLAFQITSPSAPAASTQLAFQVIHHGQAPLDSKKKYIIGCDVTTSDISTGLFQVIDGKPKLELELKITINDMLNAYNNDFVQFVKAVLDYLETDHEIIPELGCFACPGNTSANKDYIKHHHMF